MAFQIKGLDLNPERGDAFLGLTRQQAKTLGLTFIFVGFGLADIFTGIDDFLNWGVVWALTHFGISTDTAILLSYTVIAWGLVWLGCWIYPYNTHSLFNGYMNKIKHLGRKAWKKPLWLIASLLLSYVLWTWYKAKLGGLP